MDDIEAFFATLGIPAMDEWLRPDYPTRHMLIPHLTWDHCGIERRFGVTIPASLDAFWRGCSGVVLHYHPCGSGLFVWSPDMVVGRHPYFAELHHEDLLPGDLIIGEFLGCSEFLVLRCDPSAADFGAVVIGEGIDRRPDWRCAHASLGGFLAAFAAGDGGYFWERQP